MQGTSLSWNFREQSDALQNSSVALGVNGSPSLARLALTCLEIYYRGKPAISGPGFALGRQHHWHH